MAVLIEMKLMTALILLEYKFAAQIIINMGVSVIISRLLFWTRSEARQSIFEYIEVFYNRKRRHAFLNYLTPVEYEEKYTCI